MGVVVHGPEIIDSGNALHLINYLKKFGKVTAVMGGTMGRVAIIDAGLEDVISIRTRRRPSLSIRDLAPSLRYHLSPEPGQEQGDWPGLRLHGGESSWDWKASSSNRLRREIYGQSLSIQSDALLKPRISSIKAAAVAVSPRPTVNFGFPTNRDGIK